LATGGAEVGGTSFSNQERSVDFNDGFKIGRGTSNSRRTSRRLETWLKKIKKVDFNAGFQIERGKSNSRRTSRRLEI